jgi:2-oxoglutarate decarboxylase
MIDAGQVDRVVLVSGKLYWELKAKREKENDTKTALVRLRAAIPARRGGHHRCHSTATRPMPRSCGRRRNRRTRARGRSWLCICLALLGGRELKVTSRPASAATSTGLKHIHEVQQQDLVDRILSR